MPHLWNFWPWNWTKRKSHTEEAHSLLPHRTTITQSWEKILQSETQPQDSERLRERYVRFGIGGAGNIRRYFFPPLQGLAIRGADYDFI